MLSGRLISWLFARLRFSRWFSLSKTLLSRQMQGSPTFSHKRLTHSKSGDCCRSKLPTISACLVAWPSEVAVLWAPTEKLQARGLSTVLRSTANMLTSRVRSLQGCVTSVLCSDLTTFFFSFACTVDAQIAPILHALTVLEMSFRHRTQSSSDQGS